MTFDLSARDRERLAGVHPDLVAVVEKAAALSPKRFIVVEGCRTLEQQRRNVAKGVSKTLKSRHIPAANGYGHAVDLLIVETGDDRDWTDDNPNWRVIERAMKAAAAEIGVPIEWGGDWRSFVDTPHWQLPWGAYPAAKPLAKSRTMAGLYGSGAGVAVDQGAETLGGTVQSLIDTVAPAAEASETLARIVAVLKALGLALTAAGLAYAAFARWDDAGRPLPRFAPRWLARLVGSPKAVAK